MSKPIEIVQLCDQRLSTRLEMCIKNGKSIIIKDCVGLNPYLYPLLRKEITYEKSRYWITIGSKRINYNSNFQLFLMTKKPCSIPSHNIVRVVNFSITSSGLESKLLSILIDHRMPYLEQNLNHLVQEEEDNASKLYQLETDLLQMLCDAKGDLLENKALIKTLVSTRENASIMSCALKEINEAKSKIQQHYEEFRDIAKFGGDLYFLLIQLQVVSY
jgi:dynein heavy chain 2